MYSQIHAQMQSRNVFPFGLGAACPFDQRRGGVLLQIRGDVNRSTILLDDIGTDDVVERIVAAFDQAVGADAGDDGVRSVIGKGGNSVDLREAFEHFRSV